MPGKPRRYAPRATTASTIPSGGVSQPTVLLAALAILAAVQLFVALVGENRFAAQVGGIRIYPLDITAAMFAVLGLGLAFSQNRVRSTTGTAILLLAINYANLARGLLSYGPSAGVEFRPDAIVLSVILLATQARRYKSVDFAIIVGVLAASALTIYFLRRFGVVALNAFDMMYNLGTFRAGRFIVADDALMISTFGFVCIASGLRRSKPTANIIFWVLGVLGISIALIALHRSVWLAIIVGLPLLFLFQGRARLLNRDVFVVLLFGSLIVSAAAVSALLLSETIREGLLEATERQSTLQWRIQGWLGLLQLLSPLEVLIGRSFGSDYSRIVLGNVITHSAHNFYISKLFQIGIVGVLLYGTIAFRVIIGLWKVCRSDAVPDDRNLATVLLALMLGHLCYLTVYDIGISTALVLGYAIGFVQSRGRQTTGAARLGRKLNQRGLPTRVGRLS